MTLKTLPFCAPSSINLLRRTVDSIIVALPFGASVSLTDASTSTSTTSCVMFDCLPLIVR